MYKDSFDFDQYHIGTSPFTTDRIALIFNSQDNRIIVTDFDMSLRFRWSHDSAFAFFCHVNRLFAFFLVVATTLSVLRCFLSFLYRSCYQKRRYGKLKTWDFFIIFDQVWSKQQQADNRRLYLVYSTSPKQLRLQSQFLVSINFFLF